MRYMPNAYRYGVNDPYVGNAYAQLASIVTLNPETIEMGVISSVIVLVPVILLILLFRQVL
jgi:hypothetical protein